MDKARLTGEKDRQKDRARARVENPGAIVRGAFPSGRPRTFQPCRPSVAFPIGFPHLWKGAVD
jgi:hypothetical protein